MGKKREREERRMRRVPSNAPSWNKRTPRGRRSEGNGGKRSIFRGNASLPPESRLIALRAGLLAGFEKRKNKERKNGSPIRTGKDYDRHGETEVQGTGESTDTSLIGNQRERSSSEFPNFPRTAAINIC